LKRCHGACVGVEAPTTYNLRVLDALKEYQEELWPYEGAIAIKEHCPVNQITQFLVFNQWRHLGTFHAEHQLHAWKELPLKSATYHYDAYKILLSYLKNKSKIAQLMVLDKHSML